MTFRYLFLTYFQKRIKSMKAGEIMVIEKLGYYNRAQNVAVSS